MSDYLDKEIKDATPEDLHELFNSFAKGGLTPDEEAITELTTKVLSGKCAFRDVLGIDDKQMEALYTIGFNFYNSGRYEDALKVFKGLCLFDQLEYKYWLGLGATYQNLKRYEEATKVYGMATIIKSSDPRAPFHAAECYIALNDRENAINALNTVIILGKDNPTSKPFVDKAQTILKLLEEKEAAN